MTVDALTGDNWRKRRRWMVIILTWMLCNAQYLIVWGDDTGLHQNALVTLLGAIVAVMGSYVFGAVWDDNDKRRHAPSLPDDLPPPRSLGDSL